MKRSSFFLNVPPNAPPRQGEPCMLFDGMIPLKSSATGTIFVPLSLARLMQSIFVSHSTVSLLYAAGIDLVSCQLYT